MKTKSILLFRFLVILCSAIAFTSNVTAQIDTPAVYQCAPCGCDSDGKHFSEPGNCKSCGMKLEKVIEPRAELKSLDVPLNVAILIYHHAQVLDYAAPYDIFFAGGENFNVYTVAETSEKVITMPNFSVNPEYTVGNAPKPDILIIPGGMWNVLGNKTKEWIKQSAEDADYVLSVCTGAFILADLGMLDNLEATTHSAGVDLLEKNYPNIKKVQRDVRFVDNGKIITSAGVTAGMDASFHLISKVLGNDWVEAIERNLEYDFPNTERE
ncbi:DJ-1/PfpI family protein [Flagellimonas meridianipacifica]|uniref:DJ-1/PfpI family protein n=1 Tax=Flagellimonas meridianipacifica TaxID=1080225 RepID=A0A2T0MII7_9FLAO|nr:DJ-1/PfpI family protein [Allomuricauda pacifica]PRX57402.1 DJ-1/PfpI family protein [Allomuricauda pacifica]